jgi:hypothetical protein
MMGYITIGILFLVMIYQGVMHYLWLREKRKESQDMLDRIMSTDYNQYAQIRVETMKQDKKLEVVEMAELDRRMQESLETGVPV